MDYYLFKWYERQNYLGNSLEWKLFRELLIALIYKANLLQP